MIHNFNSMFSDVSNFDSGEIWMLSKSPENWIDKLLSTPSINGTISIAQEVIEKRTQNDQCLVLDANFHLKYTDCVTKKSFLCQIASPDDTRTFQPLPRFPCLSGKEKQRRKRSNHVIDTESNEGKYYYSIHRTKFTDIYFIDVLAF